MSDIDYYCFLVVFDYVVSFIVEVILNREVFYCFNDYRYVNDF